MQKLEAILENETLNICLTLRYEQITQSMVEDHILC